MKRDMLTDEMEYSDGLEASSSLYSSSYDPYDPYGSASYGDENDTLQSESYYDPYYGMICRPLCERVSVFGIVFFVIYHGS